MYQDTQSTRVKRDGQPFLSPRELRDDSPYTKPKSRRARNFHAAYKTGTAPPPRHLHRRPSLRNLRAGAQKDVGLAVCCAEGAGGSVVGPGLVGETLEGAFSAVSTPISVSHGLFCSILRDIQDWQAFVPLRYSHQNFTLFPITSQNFGDFVGEFFGFQLVHN